MYFQQLFLYYKVPVAYIEYFHGRHLPYGIVAVFFAIVIAIGLPLLQLKPVFITFTRIKPLLDQFQGSYKDKYRSSSGKLLYDLVTGDNRLS